MTSAAAGPATARRPAWARRWEHWWQQRHPRSDRLDLTQRNVYILPTGAGWLFAALLLVLLLASINYQLNLGYLLTFGLAGVGLSSMHGTHANLRGLRLLAQAGEPVFAGEMAQLRVTLLDATRPTTSPLRGPARWWWWLRRTRRGRARYGIGLYLPAAQADAPSHPGGAPPAWTWVDVPAGGEVHLQLGQLLRKRGRHRAERVRIETRYPFGLFRAWTVWRPASGWLAWPAPETPAAPLPWSTSPEADTSLPAQGTRQAAQDVAGLRAWRRGDSLTQVHWKKTAQSLAGGGDLVSRDAQGQPPARLQLDWTRTPAPDDERRLARLCAWVLAAEQAGIAYGLQLPGWELPIGLGPAQQREALHHLATWGLLEAAPDGPPGAGDSP